jgi:hypothetical protein
MKKYISNGYVPRTPLHNRIHQSLKRYNVLVCHRGFGKTHLTIGEAIDQGLVRNKNPNPRYAYVAPTYKQAENIAWDVLKTYTNEHPLFKSNEQKLRVEIERPQYNDKFQINLLGSDNPDSIRGVHLDGVIIDEFALCAPNVWSEVVSPAIVQKKGWVIFIGTPKGMNHFYDILKIAQKNEHEWYWTIQKASETGLIDDQELASIRSRMSQDEYDQEMECSFSAALVGAYYGKQMDELEKKGRITNVDYDPAVPVDTFWDLGISDSTTIWFLQQVGQEYHLIDYLENSGEGLDWYARELRKRPYIYRDCVLPHDAAARELGSGMSRAATLRKLGLGNIIILDRASIEDGIHATRMLLPKCWFDRKRCDRGIEALKSYEKRWDAKNKIFSSRPRHNWASHGADAFRYLAMGNKKETSRVDRTNLPRAAESDYDIFGGL